MRGCLVILTLLFFITSVQAEGKQHPYAKIDSLNTQAFNLRSTDKTKALALASKGLEASKKNNYLEGEAFCRNTLGLIYQSQGDYKKAKDHFLKSKEVRIAIKDTLAIARILNNIGTLERVEGNTELAFENLFEALKIFETMQATTSLGRTYINMANVYEDEGQLEKAASNYQEALKIFETTRDTLEIATTSYNLANIYYLTDELGEAKALALKSQQYYALVNNWEGMADILNILAAIAWDQDQLEEARQYFKEGIAIYEANGDESIGLCDLYTNLGIIQVELKQPQKALSALKEARRLLTGKGSIEDHLYLDNNFAEAFHAMNQYDSAYHYQTLARNRQDSLYQVEKTEAIAEMQTKYETERKEKELAEERLLREKYANQRSLLFQLLIASLVILGLLYLFFRQRQKAAAIIAQQKAKIHEQEVADLLQEQELKMVNAALEGQEVERRRIAKDLHDRLGSMLTTLKWRFDGLLERETTSAKKEPLEEANQMLDNAYHEVRRIAHDMNSGVLNKFGLVPALEELASTLQKNGTMKVEVQTFGLTKRLDTALEIIVYRIIQELVSNVLKHAQATELSIQVNNIDNNLQIAVEDNGLGFDAQKMKEGMGLKNIEARLQSWNGQLEVDSELGRGTIVFVDLPQDE